MAETDTIRKKKGPGKIRRTLQIVNRNFRSFFWFEFFYKAVTFTLFTPLLRELVSLVLYANGISNLTNYNFLHFLSNPLTWILLVGILYLVGAFIAIEFAGLINGIHASEEGRKITVLQMFDDGFSDAGRVFQLKNWIFLVYVLLVLPFANITESASLTNSFAIPGFIMETINDLKWLTVLYFIALLYLAWLALKWLYVIPAMAVYDEGFQEASRQSAVLMKKHMLGGILKLIGSYLLLGLYMLGLYLGLLAAFFFGVKWLDPSSASMSLYTNAAVFFLIVLILLFTIMSAPVVLARIYVSYEQRQKDAGVALREYIPAHTWIQKNKWTKIGAAALLACGLYFFLPARYQEVKGIIVGQTTPAMVMAHRGDSVDAPENTLPAFQAAIDNGADAAEMDVQMTKDGTIVVLHDSSVDRTSNGKGNIWDLTYDQIKDLDNGSFFSAKFADTRIPTLDQVIKLCKGRLYLNIEIKRTGHDDGIEQKVLDIIHQNNFQDECDITSMDYKTIETVRSLDPSIKTVYTTTVAYGSLAKLDAADAFSVEATFVNSDFVRYLRQHGKEIYVWTVNDESQMDKMVNLGVDAIITNDPVGCRTIVSQQRDAVTILERFLTAIEGS